MCGKYIDGMWDGEPESENVKEGKSDSGRLGERAKGRSGEGVFGFVMQAFVFVVVNSWGAVSLVTALIRHVFLFIVESGVVKESILGRIVSGIGESESFQKLCAWITSSALWKALAGHLKLFIENIRSLSVKTARWIANKVSSLFSNLFSDRNSSVGSLSISNPDLPVRSSYFTHSPHHSISLSSSAFYPHSAFRIPHSTIMPSLFSSFVSGGLLCLFSFVLLISGILFFFSVLVYPQQTYRPGIQTQQQYQPPTNFRSPSAFRQEIMRMEINVIREGFPPLPITQVPRVEKGDIIKLRLLEEQVNGLKPDESFWDWTLLVAYFNPNRNKVSKQAEKAGGSAVSEEIQFRKTGWYKEYSFKVPYDSQPVFFLYPKPKYRNKILSLVNKKYEDIKNLGEKAIDIAGAYAQIGSFLGELQGVLNQSQQGYGYGYGFNSNYQSQFMFEQMVERTARSFNIQLPDCWKNGTPFGNVFNTYNNPNSFNGFGGLTNDFVGRVQCVAKGVRLEDFDLSVGRMLQQGAIFAASQLQQKYPQIAYWINIAAVAIDFIIKITKRTPLRVVPTLVTTQDMQNGAYGGGYQQPYQNYSSSSYSGAGGGGTGQPPASTKISLFADTQPTDMEFVTAFPVMVHKWQAEGDPKTIQLPAPTLLEPCLHQGQNILKNTDLAEEWINDSFSKDFKIVISSPNGFRKEFPLKKNFGAGGWELNITPEDINAFPKIAMTLESEMKGTRGFNEIKSPKFNLPIAIGGQWEVKQESQKTFSVGGKRRVTLQNSIGNCGCLRAVIYKPPFGGQFVFEAGSRDNSLQFSEDGREVSFEVDATNFQPGQGTLELRQYGGESANVNLKLYPAPPDIQSFEMHRGDREALITGERLEQLQSVKINGKRAVVAGASQGYPNQYQNQQPQAYPQPQQYPVQQMYPNQPNQAYPNQQQGQYPNQAQGQYPNSSSPSLPVSSSSPVANIAPALYSNINPNQRVVVFEDPAARLTEGNITLELGLEDDRSVPFSKTFKSMISRPAIAADKNGEIEAIPVGPNPGIKLQTAVSQVQIQTNVVQGSPSNVQSRKPGARSQRSATNNQLRNKNQLPATNNQLPITSYPVLPIDTSQLSLTVQNILTDHDFKTENLVVETRIEKSQVSPNELPVASFEVLDWKTMKISFSIGEQVRKYLGGRRIQFRIRDKERGDSDWYTIKQTFIRMPKVASVKCTNDMNGMCELKGTGIDYIAQVSINGGQTWFPQSPQTLIAQPTQDGQTMAMIPLLANRKLFLIKLRDFPTTQGISAGVFTFSNTVKASRVQSATAQPNSAQPSNTPRVPQSSGVKPKQKAKS